MRFLSFKGFKSFSVWLNRVFGKIIGDYRNLFLLIKFEVAWVKNYKMHFNLKQTIWISKKLYLCNSYLWIIFLFSIIFICVTFASNETKEEAFLSLLYLNRSSINDPINLCLDERITQSQYLDSISCLRHIDERIRKTLICLEFLNQKEKYLLIAWFHS